MKVTPDRERLIDTARLKCVCSCELAVSEPFALGVL